MDLRNSNAGDEREVRGHTTEEGEQDQWFARRQLFQAEIGVEGLSLLCEVD